MDDFGAPAGWSAKFKRSMVLVAVIAIAPVLSLFQAAARVSLTGYGARTLFWLGLALIAAGGWYLLDNCSTPRDGRAMNERETLVYCLALSAVVALIAVEPYYPFAR